MKLWIIRFLKKGFVRLRLHVLFDPFASVFLNLFYLTKFSKWASSQGKMQVRNDFPSKWDYNKRFALYQSIMKSENLESMPVNYLEFGVADGYSFNWFMQRLDHPQSRFFGFDTFTGLPEDFGPLKKGYFANSDTMPVPRDDRGKFHQGLFQQTLPGFLSSFNDDKRKVIMLDADLYSATLFVLTSLAPFLKPGDLIFFDEFSVPTHEFKALQDFSQAYYVNLQFIGAANNYYFSAFKVTGY